MNATTRRHARGELEHLKTIEEAVLDFRHPDPVLRHTMAASSLPEAIERACAGVTAKGEKFRHDQYLRPSVVENLKRNLIEHMHHLRLATNFDDLHDKIYILRPKGIGHLKVFDVTMQIGAYLGIDLDSSGFVYIHRGALVGWQNLTGSRAKPHRVPISSLPAALRVMPHYLVEDFFCEYRTWLNPQRPMSALALQAAE